MQNATLHLIRFARKIDLQFSNFCYLSEFYYVTSSIALLNSNWVIDLSLFLYNWHTLFTDTSNIYENKHYHHFSLYSYSVLGDIFVHYIHHTRKVNIFWNYVCSGYWDVFFWLRMFLYAIHRLHPIASRCTSNNFIIGPMHYKTATTFLYNRLKYLWGSLYFMGKQWSSVFLNRICGLVTIFF